LRPAAGSAPEPLLSYDVSRGEKTTSLASQPPDRAEVEEALFELQQYLSDRIAPLMVADSIELLTRCPVDVVVAQLDAWTSAQYLSGRAGVPVSDYLFHAVQKIHILGEFKLLPATVLDPYLDQVKQAVLGVCPVEDRELLASNLGRLGASVSGPAPAVDILYRQPGAAVSAASAPLAAPAHAVVTSAVPVPAAAPLAVARPGVAAVHAAPVAAAADPIIAADVAHSLRRLTLLLDRLATQPAAAPAGPGPSEQTELVSQVLTTATASAANGRELDQHLDRLRALGGPARTDQIFQALGDSLPGWSLDSPSLHGAGSPADHSGPAEAMRRLVTLAQDTAEAARRYRDLVHTAIRQVNDGALPRAATILDLATQLAAGRHVPAPTVDAIRNSGHDHLDADRLRKLAETPGKHAVLARVMTFFARLTPDGLLDDLAREDRHDRRRHLVTLLEAHGTAARTAVIARLEAAAGQRDQTDPFFLRNLIYLLRILPRPEGASAADEVVVIGRAVRSTSPLAVVKEALSTLGKIEHETAEDALLAYLRRFESMLESPRAGAHPREETEALVERTIAGLARGNTGRAIKAVVDHGLRDAPELGNTRARLVELGARDLTPHPELVLRLLAALEAEVPRGLASLAGAMINKRKGENVISLIQSLRGTRVAEVWEAFQGISSRHPNEGFGQVAAQALQSLSEAPPSRPPMTAALSGDLEVFGMPNLLQNMADNKGTGTLTLFDEDGHVTATLVLERGGLRSAQHGLLRGAEAVYQLVEKPFPGQFAFVSPRDAPAEVDTSGALEVAPVLLEGLRRYDELRLARALVPDETNLRPTGTVPPAHPDEPNEALVESIWDAVRSGATATACERKFPVDSFRIRRLLAYWIEKGALKVPGRKKEAP
jgi:hypothetical protein